VEIDNNFKVVEGVLFILVDGKYVPFGEKRVDMTNDMTFTSSNDTIDFDKLSGEGKELFELYKATLNLDDDLAKKIISGNQSAIFTLNNKKGRILFNKMNEVSILIKVTLDRDDITPLTEDEIDKLRKKYK
jgi:hypothetical protein